MTDEIKSPYPYDCVEVDIKNQCVNVYKSGKRIFTSPVVTGTKGVNDTPIGTFHIFEMETEKDFCGDPNYHANCWAAFETSGKGAGFHDAPWRRTKVEEFGKEVYLTNGTAGCVHLPLDRIKEFYGLLYLGMPVISHDGEITWTEYKVNY